MAQDMMYTLSTRRPTSASGHIRTRRLVMNCLVVLLFGASLFVSATAIQSGQHWWGLDAQLTQVGTWRITWVAPGLAEDAGVKVNDQILLADGHPPTTVQEINQAGRLLIDRAGSTHQTVLWKPPNSLDQILSFALVALGAVALVIGIIVFLHATERPLAWRFLILWTTLAVSIGLQPATSYGNQFAVLVAQSVSVGLFPGLLASFLWLLLFPTPSKLTRVSHWLAELPVLSGMTVVGLYFASILAEQQPLSGLVTMLGRIQVALVLILVLIYLLVASFRPRGSISRERARMLLGGMIVGLAPLLILTVIPLLAFGQSPVPGQISALALVALPLSFAYAILRRDLLRVDSLIRNTAQIILTIMGLGLIVGLLVALLTALSNPSVAIAISFTLGVLALPPIGRGARIIVETWLFPQIKRYRELIGNGQGIEETGLDPQRLVGQLLSEVHLALPVRLATVFVPDKHTGQLFALPSAETGLAFQNGKDGKGARSSDLQPQSLLLEAPVWTHLQRRHRPCFVEVNAGHPAPDTRRPSPLQLAEDALWKLLIPMRVQRQLVGVLALGQREDKQPFSETDLQILTYLCTRRSLALDYALHYADLHEAYKQRQELDAAKDRLIITAHHELRTPLTNVQGYLELLRALGPEGRQSRPQDVALFIERGCEQADELVEQVESLLQAAEVGTRSEHLQLTSVRAREAAQQAIHALDVKIRQGGFRLYNRIPPEVIVHADASALVHILTNVLANSLKYSSEDRRTIIVSSKQPQDALEQGWTIYWASPPLRSQTATVDLLIRDWGHGIPPAAQPQIFERFVRLERDLNSPARGSGLGLAICKELTEAMGGQIGVSSHGLPKEGTFFIVRLPIEVEGANNEM
jgi:signal transduction histidine kinase